MAAAIEFCRARIVDMSVEEFEEWFTQAFPKVLRPNTAPARGGRSGANTSAAGAAAGSNGYVAAGGGGVAAAAVSDGSGAAGGSHVTITINNMSPGHVVPDRKSKGGGGGGGQGQGQGHGIVRLAQGEGRSAVRSAVSVANGADGRRRMVQSAMVRRR